MPDDAYAIVEAMGHRKMAGRITEAELAGVKMLQVEVLGRDGSFVGVQRYPGAALFCVTDVDEDRAKRYAANQWGGAGPLELGPAPTTSDDDLQQCDRCHGFFDPEDIDEGPDGDELCLGCLAADRGQQIVVDDVDVDEPI